MVVLGDEAEWGLAIVTAEALAAEDVSLHLATVAGEGAAALGLLTEIQRLSAEPIRFRLPEPDPPLLRGQAAAYAGAGFRGRDWVLHIIARPM